MSAHLTPPSMLKRLLVPVVLCCLTHSVMAQSSSGNGNGNVLIIVSSKSPVSTLSAKEVTDMYLGRTRNLPNGERVMPLDNPSDSSVRARFYKALTGKAITDINAYWARLLFTGQSSPPLSMSSTQAIVSSVKNNPSAIGYIESGQISNFESSGLKVVLSVNAP